MSRFRTFITLAAAPLLAGVIVLSGLPSADVRAAFAGGTGVSGDPYQISDCTQLAEIDDTTANLAAQYLLTAAITCSGSFTPLKNGSTYFSGSLNGNGHAISGLSLSCGTSSLCGLFAATSAGASIVDLTLTSPTVSSSVATYSGGAPYASVGALVGEAKGTLTLSGITVDTPSITASGDAVGGVVGYALSTATLTATNISVTGGSISGGVMVGGLFGWVQNGSITDVDSSAAVSGLGVVGGILGQGGTTSYTGLVTIDQATVTGTVTASLYASINSRTGGVAGQLFGKAAESSRLTRSQVTAGGVSGDGIMVGGLIGSSAYLIVANSYATVTVDGNQANASGATNATSANVGGLIGSSQIRTTISDSHFTGTVTSTNPTLGYQEFIGGVIGSTNGTTTLARSYSTGAVTGSSYIGGLIGHVSTASRLTILNSYSQSTVSYSRNEASDYEGGLVGNIDQSVTTDSARRPKDVASIVHSYFAGTMSPSGSSTNKYGLYGQGRAACSDTYFDRQTSGATYAAVTTQFTTSTYGNYCGSPLGVGATTADMQTQATFVGWDFTTVWSHSTGQYPALRTTAGVSASSPDLVAPNAPTTPDLAASSDTGSSNSDNLTSASSLEMSATTAEDGGIVRFVANGSSDRKQQCSAPVSASAATCTIPNIESGSWSITATHFDDAGNESASSTALSVSVDTTAPTRSSTVPADNATNVALDAVITMTFSENVVAGAGSIVIYSGSTCATTYATYAATDAEVTYSARVVTIDPATDFTMGTKYCVTYTGTAFRDAVDNYAAAQTSLSAIDFTALSDVTAPAAPGTPNLDAASDLGQSSTDDLTADATPTVTVIAAEAGGTVTVTATKTGSANVTCTLAGSTSGNSCTLGTLAEGTWSITAVHRDAAGNDSPASGALSITIDTTAPTRTVVNPTDGATGVSTGASPTITFNDTVIAGGGNIVIYSGASCATTVATIASSNAQVSIGGSTVTIDPSTDFDQNTKHCITYAASAFTDVAGNQVAALSLAAGDSDFSFTTAADTTAPAAPGRPDLDAADDTGQSSSDNVTAVDAPTVSVIATENGGTVTVTATKTGSSNVTCTLAGSTSGNSCTLGTLAEGIWSVTAVHRDAAGNDSPASGALSITIDTTAPTIATYSPTPGATGITRRPTLTMTFTEDVFAEGPGRVRLRDYNLMTDEETFLGSAAAVSISGETVTIDSSVLLDTATLHNVAIDYIPTTGIFVDLAGNSFAGISLNTTWQFTTTADGTAPTATWTEPSTPSSSRSLSYGLAFSEAVTGLTSVDFSNSGTATGCTYAPNASTGTSFTIAVSCPSDGTVILGLAAGGARDVAGNDGPTTTLDASSVTISSPPPAAVTTTTTLPSPTRTLSITGAAASYLVTQAGPGLTAVPSAGSGAISWASLTPGVCSIGSIAMMSILSKQSSVTVGRLNTVGTCTIRASIAATSAHDAASSTVSFAVTRVRPTLRLSVRALSPDDRFFLRVTLPAAVSSNQTLLEQIYAAVQFDSTTPDSCEVDTITAYDESIAQYGSSWAGVHVTVNRSGDDACSIRAELPLGVRWFRVTGDPSTMIATTESTTSTTPTTEPTVAPSTTLPGSTTTVPESTTSGSGEPSLTSFAPTPVTTPVIELDLQTQIIVEENVTSIVISGDSIETSARNLNVTAGFVRIRPNNGEWTRVSLPRPEDVTITLTARTTSLDVRFEPLDGEPILVSVPLAIVVNDSRTWIYALMALLVGAGATYFWFTYARRRRRRAMPPPPAV
jgi:hypothetical protein